MGDLLKDFNIDSFREGNRFEAKLAKGGFPKSLWETYSSFANTDGGLILLGVKENRDHTFTIEGVENPERMEKLFWDNVNNKNVVNINILGNNNVEIKDIYGRAGVVIKKYKDYFVFENPGMFRLSIKEAISGGTSDPRNATILKMFSMIDIGERAGSGIPGVFSVWEKEFGLKPEYTQKISLERTITVLKLAEIAQRTSDNCPENVEIAQRNSENCPENDLILPPNCPEIAQRTYLAIATNPYATIEELSEKMDVSPRTVKYHIALLRDKFIKRIGSDTKGYWEIIEENHQQGEII